MLKITDILNEEEIKNLPLELNEAFGDWAKNIGQRIMPRVSKSGEAQKNIAEYTNYYMNKWKQYAVNAPDELDAKHFKNWLAQTLNLEPNQVNNLPSFKNNPAPVGQHQMLPKDLRAPIEAAVKLSNWNKVNANQAQPHINQAPGIQPGIHTTAGGSQTGVNPAPNNNIEIQKLDARISNIENNVNALMNPRKPLTTAGNSQTAVRPKVVPPNVNPVPRTNVARGNRAPIMGEMREIMDKMEAL